MKILESIIWDLPKSTDFDDLIPGYAHLVKMDMIHSIRVPMNKEYIWHYYLLNSRNEEDLYLYRAMDEHIVSHVIIAEKYQQDNIAEKEIFIDKITDNFEIPPLVILHSLHTPDDLIQFTGYSPWQLENNIYLSFQKGENFPLALWNKICTKYLKETVLKNSSNSSVQK